MSESCHINVFTVVVSCMFFFSFCFVFEDITFTFTINTQMVNEGVAKDFSGHLFFFEKL